MPPATPRPEKSASFVSFFERSISGMTSGMLMGAVSTWKPLAIGGGATASGGGGGVSSGGAGSSFLISTKSTFWTTSSATASATCFVASTDIEMMTPWKTMEKIVEPKVRVFWGFDSIRLLNTRTSPRVKSRVTAPRGASTVHDSIRARRES